MKQATIFLSCFVSWFMVFKIQPLYSLFLTGFLFAAFYFIKHKVKLKREMKKYKELKDDIYLITCHPESGVRPILPRFDDEKAILIELVEYNGIFKMQQEQTKKLIQSGNELFMHPERVNEMTLNGIPILAAEDAIEIILLIYREGENRLENWSDFVLRVDDTIKSQVENKHAKLKKTDAVWYSVNYLGGKYKASEVA